MRPPTVVASRTLIVPIEGDASAPQVAEVLLYVSVDGGAHWVWQQSAPATAQQFVVRLPADGEFWFTARTRDASGALHPAEPLRPQQHVHVDTQAPQLQLAAHRTATGRVAVHWQAADPTLQPESLVLQWRVETGDATWQRIAWDGPAAATDPAAPWQGRTEFDAPAAAALEVVARIRDQAGHETTRTARVPGCVIALPPRDAPSPSQGGDALGVRAPAARDSGDALGAGGLAVPATGDVRASPPAAHTTGLAETTVASDPAADAWRPSERAGRPSASGRQEPPGEAAFRTASTVAVPAAESRWTAAAPAEHSLPPQTLPAQPQRTPLAPVAGEHPDAPTAPAVVDTPWVVASRRFAVAHRLQCGTGSVLELWATRDAGASWRRLSLQQNDSRPLLAQVDEDGLYGLRLSVQAAGAAPLPPLAGEVPHVWVLVDAMPPTCRIASVRQRPDGPAPVVEVRYVASDLRLAQRPITLRYRAEPQEPWSPIATGLENSGQFVWHVAETLGPDRRPTHVELQLDVRDAAGNTAQAQTDAPLPLAWPEAAGLVREIRATAAPAGAVARP